MSTTIHAVTVTPIDFSHFDTKSVSPFQRFANLFSRASSDDVTRSRLCSSQGSQSKRCFQAFADAFSSVTSKASKLKDAIVNMFRPAAAPKKQESEAEVRKRCEELVQCLYGLGAEAQARSIRESCPATGIVGLKNLELNLKDAVRKAGAEPSPSIAQFSAMISENSKSLMNAAMLNNQWQHYASSVDKEVASGQWFYSLKQMSDEFKCNPEGQSEISSGHQLNKGNLAARLNELAQGGLATTAHMLNGNLLQMARDCGLQPAFRDDIAAAAKPAAEFFTKHGGDSVAIGTDLYDQAVEMTQSVVDVLDRIKREAAAL